MTVIFYKNNSAPNVTNKDTTQTGTFNGTLRANCDILDPIITFNDNIEFLTSGIGTANYFYIPEFGRRYFYDGIATFINGLYTVSGHVDVLSTYWESLKNCKCIVGRNEFKRTKDLIDTELWCTADSLYGFKKFPNSPLRQAVGQNYVMTVAGAGTSSPTPEPSPEE